MTDRRQSIGRRAEAIAQVRLREMGYRVLEANYRCPYGEIDLVTRDSGEYVFVEVRSKSAKSAGQPEESITPRKRGHLIATAQEYLQAHDADGADWRIDLVAIEFGANGTVARFDVLRNSVEF
jgi:putative endonuclease